MVIKFYFCIFLLSTLLQNYTMGQMNLSVTETFLKENIISNKQLKSFERTLQGITNKENSHYLIGLLNLQKEAIFGKDYPSIAIIHFEDSPLPSKQQDNVNKTLLHHLDVFKKLNFISQGGFDTLKTNIIKNNYKHLYTFLIHSVDIIEHEENFSKERLSKYAKKLFDNNLLTQESYNQLKKDIELQKIQSCHAFINYCKHAVWFDLAKYSNDSSVYLEQIHREVSNILPELKFTDFSYKIEKDTSFKTDKFVFAHVTVILKAFGKIYKQKSHITLRNKPEDFSGKISEQDFYQIFNKILIDRQSPYRLHLIRANQHYDGYDAGRHFSIIALEQYQTKDFNTAGDYFSLSYEKYKNRLTSNQIDDAIQKYQEIGLFKHLTDEQIKKSIQDIKESEIEITNDILYRFPNIILAFDTEFDNLESPYTNLIKKYAQTSNYEFNPANISDNFNMSNHESVLQFTWNQKVYKQPFRINRDWIDPNFFKFISDVIAEGNLKGRFYMLLGDGQVIHEIYLKPEQYDFIKKHKLAIFYEDWKEADDD